MYITRINVPKLEKTMIFKCTYLDLELQKFHVIDCLFKHCAYVNLHYTRPSMKLIHNSIEFGLCPTPLTSILKTKITLFTLVPFGTRFCRILSLSFILSLLFCKIQDVIYIKYHTQTVPSKHIT